MASAIPSSATAGRRAGIQQTNQEKEGAKEKSPGEATPGAGEWVPKRQLWRSLFNVVPSDLSRIQLYRAVIFLIPLQLIHTFLPVDGCPPHHLRSTALPTHHLR